MDSAAVQRDADMAEPSGVCCPRDRLHGKPPHSPPLRDLPPHQVTVQDAHPSLTSPSLPSA